MSGVCDAVTGALSERRRVPGKREGTERRCEKRDVIADVSRGAASRRAA